MNREEKGLEIEALRAKFVKSSLAILTDYKGIKVNDFNELRTKLREKNSELQVVKNRLAKIALEGSDFTGLKDHFKGTTAVTLADIDLVGPAKVLTDFFKSHEPIKFKAAIMQGKVISAKELEALAKLPSREELIAKLMGSMQAPARNLVTVLAQIPRQIVTVLAAVRDKKEKGE